MPGPKLDPVASDPDLPSAVDVVVIGGGIVGASAALELADKGLKVALCEKGEVGAEQSSRNWGWVRLTHRDPREMALMMESVRLWQGMDERVGAKTGYTQCGITFSCPNEKDMAYQQGWAETLNSYQIPARVIDRDEALSRFPGLDANIAGALYNPADGRAEPQKAAPAIARAAQALGATIHQNCAVRVVETAAGKISGVVTEKGRIACSAVLVAGGAWSRMFLGNLGIHLPALQTTGTVLRTSPVEDGPEGTFKCSGYTLRRRTDGGYTISGPMTSLYEITPDSFRLMSAFLPSLKTEFARLNFRFGRRFVEELKMRRKWGSADVTPFEETRIYDPKPDAKAIDNVLETLKKDYPVFRDATIAQRWAGYIDVLPDIIPAISSTEGVPNGIPGLFVASGFSGHGFGLGPGAGRLAADLVAGDAPIVDPTEFRLSRFTDGTKISPMANVMRN